MFDDHFVAVGDAAATRLYKDGIGSAFLTSERAAWTALHAGVSAQALARGCGPLYRSITRDNRIGQFLFATWQGDKTPLYHLWERCWWHILSADEARPLAKRHSHLALWNILTGDASYTHIMLEALHPRILAAITVAALAELRPKRRTQPSLSRQPHEVT